MELWDAYHKNGTPAGRDLRRGEPIPAGLFHLVTEILVRHTDGSYLLMQRDPQKKAFPGMFEATAGGSALKGEAPLTAALRELQEETGITTHELAPIGQTLSHDTLYYSYLCITDCGKNAITLQAGETVGFRWVSETEFMAFLHSAECIPPQQRRLLPYFQSQGL